MSAYKGSSTHLISPEKAAAGVPFREDVMNLSLFCAPGLSNDSQTSDQPDVAKRDAS